VRRPGNQPVKEGGSDKNKFQALMEISLEDEDHTKEGMKKQQTALKTPPTTPAPQKASGHKTEETPDPKSTQPDLGEREMEMHTQENQTKPTQEVEGYEIDMEEVEKQPKI
jgi:hypothetical protein